MFILQDIAVTGLVFILFGIMCGFITAIKNVRIDPHKQDLMRNASYNTCKLGFTLFTTLTVVLGVLYLGGII